MLQVRSSTKLNVDLANLTSVMKVIAGKIAKTKRRFDKQVSTYQSFGLLNKIVAQLECFAENYLAMPAT